MLNYESVDPIETAITESLKSKIISRPNPWVGAALVPKDCQDDPKKWFLGHTKEHAEVVAIKAAGRAALSSTLYVTLEPCSHYGKTGPCTKAIIDAKISRVVVGIKDPDKNVNGSGIKVLRESGVTVDFFPDQDKLKIIKNLLPYLWHRVNGNPYFLLKMATTLDGIIATRSGDSKWVSGETSRKAVHFLRATSDAIVVGVATLKNDDPELTVRYGYDKLIKKQPERIVFGEVLGSFKATPYLRYSGEVNKFCESFKDKDFQQVMIEGGSKVAYEFLRSNLLNQITVFMAPKIYGANDGITMFSGIGTDLIADLKTGSFESVEQLGEDIRIDYLSDITVKFIESILEKNRNEN